MAKTKSKTTASAPATRSPRTRKYRSRSEREAQVNRYVVITAAAIAVVIILVLGGAVLYEGVLVPLQPVASVAGQGISTRDFQRRVTLERWRTGTQLAAQLSGVDPQYAQQLLGMQGSPFAQVYQNLSQPGIFGGNVLDDMENNIIIQQYAQQKGISADPSVVDQRIQTFFGYDPTGSTPTPTVTPTLTTTPLVSPTPTSTPTPTLPPTQTQTPTPSPFPTGLPTATPGPTERKQTFDKNRTDYLAQAAKLTGASEADVRQLFYEQVLRDKVEESLFGKVQTQQEQVKVRQIVLKTEVDANNVLASLKNGESFSNLARIFSQDSASASSGGEVDWQAKGQSTYGTDFDSAAFNESNKVGDVIGPIKTADQQGNTNYNVIQIEGRETRSIDESTATSIRDKQFTDWLTQQQTADKATKYDYWADRIPDTPTLTDLGLPTGIQPQSNPFGSGSSPFGQ
ncbi:MAG TPA: peptidylprolyl isomerase [Aggregatilineales bacterium]|nr:peptidylprolyl isomerase [Aggregatilineales bacterium]